VRATHRLLRPSGRNLRRHRRTLANFRRRLRAQQRACSNNCHNDCEYRFSDICGRCANCRAMRVRSFCSHAEKTLSDSRKTVKASRARVQEPGLTKKFVREIRGAKEKTCESLVSKIGQNVFENRRKQLANHLQIEKQIRRSPFPRAQLLAWLLLVRKCLRQQLQLIHRQGMRGRIVVFTRGCQAKL